MLPPHFASAKRAPRLAFNREHTDQESACFPALNPVKRSEVMRIHDRHFRGVPRDVPRIQNLTSDSISGCWYLSAVR